MHRPFTCPSSVNFRTRWAASALLAVSLGTPQAMAQCEPEVLISPDTQSGQAYGQQVALAGDQILASAPLTDVPMQIRRGVVHVNEWDSQIGLHTHRQTLAPSNSAGQMFFGTSLSVLGDVAAVGAPGHPTSRTGGEVFVYARDAVTGLWSETQALSVSNPRAFGTTVVLRGEFLFITEAFGINGSAGRLHVYRQSPGGQYSPLQIINSGLLVDSNRFPTAVELTGTGLLALGDPSAETGGFPRAGAVRLMQLNAVTGLFESAGQLESSDPNLDGQFGATLAWNGDDLIVSEHGDDLGSLPRGDARVYREQPGGGLALHEIIEFPQTEFAVTFGRVLACEGDHAVFESTTAGFPAGNLSIYRKDPLIDSWTFEARYGPRSPFPIPEGTTSAAIAGPKIAMGSASVGDPFTRQGRVLVLEPGTAPCATVGTVYCALATPNSTGQVGGLNAIGEASVNAGAALGLYGYDLPPGALVLALVSREPGYVSWPGAAGPLCLGGPLGRFLGQAGLASANGAYTCDVDNRNVPSPTGPFRVELGEALHFQLWHRDIAPSTNSQFTRAIRIVFEL